jgi:dTDP-4-amino-4,6-dideoxygalactose transaminase
MRSKQRDALKVHLEQQGVSTVIHYPIPPHRQACYQDFRGSNLPIAEMLAEEVLSLPMSPYLSDDDVNWVVQVLKEYRH